MRKAHIQRFGKSQLVFVATSRGAVKPKSLQKKVFKSEKVSTLKGGQEWTLTLVLSKPVLGSSGAGFRKTPVFPIFCRRFWTEQFQLAYLSP